MLLQKSPINDMKKLNMLTEKDITRLHMQQYYFGELIWIIKAKNKQKKSHIPTSMKIKANPHIFRVFNCGINYSLSK